MIVSNKAFLSLLFFSLQLSSFFINVCNSGCIDGSCSGCSGGGTNGPCDEGNGCLCFKDDAVYGCCGTWTERGMFTTGSGSVAELCADGYEVCPSASRASELGMTNTDCGSNEENEFFGSQQSGTSGTCDETGTDDVYGCSKTTASNGVWNTARGMTECDGTFVAMLSTTSDNNWDFNNEVSNEINAALLSNANYGGPLCCRKATSVPTEIPSPSPSNPSGAPSTVPSQAPSQAPSKAPSQAPSKAPSMLPTITPTIAPSSTPSIAPSVMPSNAPTMMPSMVPSNAPTSMPLVVPSDVPTKEPSGMPSKIPSTTPSIVPSMEPIEIPSNSPTFVPSSAPTPENGIS